MQVAIDTNGLYTTQAGVARYIRGLLKGLALMRDAEFDFFELGWPVENFGYAQPQRALKTAYRELFWARQIAPRILRSQRADLLHSTVSCLIPAAEELRQVLTIHDLAFLRFPNRFRRWQRHSWGQMLKRIPAVDRIICISRFTADEVMRLLDLPASRLAVVYNGCDFHPDEPAPVESQPGCAVPPEFFLFVGSLEPGKNLALLKDVYALAESRGITLPPLLVVGARWEGVASEGKPPHAWQYLGRQPDAVLVYLYRRATALVFPSKYEGFGLPICEAMALGCPVLCSPVASLPEVAGRAALFCDMKPEAYLEGLQDLTRRPELRSSLIEHGRRQAGAFSWRKCARETKAAYESVLTGG